MTEASERQVLYALVAGGFLAIVGVLIAFAQAVGLVPGWWTALAGVGWLATAVVVVIQWRRTGRVLLVTIGLFVAWTVGTLVVS